MLALGRRPPSLLLGLGFWNLSQMGEHHLLIYDKCLQHEFVYLGPLLPMFRGYHICSPNLWPPVGGLVERFNCCQLSISELERWTI